MYVKRFSLNPKIRSCPSKLPNLLLLKRQFIQLILEKYKLNMEFYVLHLGQKRCDEIAYLKWKLNQESLSKSILLESHLNALFTWLQFHNEFKEHKCLDVLV